MNENNDLRIYAHRGIHITCAENSREAVENAYESSVDVLEVDLRQLSDGQIVFHHDQAIKTYNNKGEANYSDLGSLSLDSFSKNVDFEPMTLPKALEEKPPSKHVVLECKPHRNSLGFCRNLIQYTDVYNMADVLFSSESWKQLRILNQLTDVPLAPVIRRTIGIDQTLLKNLNWDEIHVRKNLLFDSSIRSLLKSINSSIIAWTVNSNDTLMELKDLGIDGYMTDNENLM